EVCGARMEERHRRPTPTKANKKGARGRRVRLQQERPPFHPGKPPIPILPWPDQSQVAPPPRPCSHVARQSLLQRRTAIQMFPSEDLRFAEASEFGEAVHS